MEAGLQGSQIQQPHREVVYVVAQQPQQQQLQHQQQHVQHGLQVQQIQQPVQQHVQHVMGQRGQSRSGRGCCSPGCGGCGHGCCPRCCCSCLQRGTPQDNSIHPLEKVIVGFNTLRMIALLIYFIAAGAGGSTVWYSFIECHLLSLAMGILLYVAIFGWRGPLWWHQKKGLFISTAIFDILTILPIIMDGSYSYDRYYGPCDGGGCVYDEGAPAAASANFAASIILMIVQLILFSLVVAFICPCDCEKTPNHNTNPQVVYVQAPPLNSKSAVDGHGQQQVVMQQPSPQGVQVKQIEGFKSVEGSG